MKKPLSKTTFNLMMLLCIIVWALAFPLIRLALQDLSFTSLTILRFIIVCLAALIIIAVQPRKFSPLQKKDILPIFLIGCFGVMMYHFGLNYGEQYVTAGAASLLIATIPVFTIILSIIFLKEKLTPTTIIGVLLALIGVLIISILGAQNTALEVTHLGGALAILMAAIMGSLYTIAGKKLLARYSALSLTLYAMLLGSLVLLPTLLLTPTFIGEITHMSLVSWFAVIFLGLCSTIIGYVLWYVALEIKTVSEVSVYLYGIPVLSTIISYVLFGDQITIFFLLGGAFVITGLLLVERRNNRNNTRKNHDGTTH
ncbi:MAG: DMT family transporter [Methanobacteriota archaeon]